MYVKIRIPICKGCRDALADNCRLDTTGPLNVVIGGIEGIVNMCRMLRWIIQMLKYLTLILRCQDYVSQNIVIIET